MQTHPYSLNRVSAALRAGTRKFAANDRGTAAVEFGIVAVPFFMFVFSIIGVGLYFFTSHALENGVESAARKIRTGEAQKGNLTVGEFKTLFCKEAGSYIDCNKVRVLIASSTSWSGVNPQPCVDNANQMTQSTGQPSEPVKNYTGEASQVALVTVCYEWDLAKTFGFLKLGSGPQGSGSAIMQAASAFRIEPYATS